MAGRRGRGPMSHCTAYAIVPVWFARFAVRARSKLGLTCERKTRRGQSLRTRRHPAVARHTTLHVYVLVVHIFNFLDI